MRLKDQCDGYGRTLPSRGRQERFWRRVAAANGVELADHTSTRLTAYVNHGRWVADCPACNGGILAPNPGSTAPCLDCGRLYTVDYPARRDRIEGLLLVRPREENRNWRPGETPAMLEAENIAHRVAP